MRVLGIECATRRASVAAWESGCTPIATDTVGAMQHAEHLAHLLDQTIQKAGWTKSSIDRIACGIGPGSFTGVRVAIATAKGVAMGLDRPLVGVITLEAMVQAFLDQAPFLSALIVAMIDAKKGEIFAGLYDEGGKAKFGPTHVKYAEACHLVSSWSSPGERLVVLGEVAHDLVLPSEQVYRDPFTDLPHAVAVAMLGAKQEGVSGPALESLEPLYLRPPDITLPRPIPDFSPVGQ